MKVRFVGIFPLSIVLSVLMNPAHLLGLNPAPIAVNPSTNMVYVGDTYPGSVFVSVIDGTTDEVVATIPPPSQVSNARAYQIAVNSTTNRIYVNTSVGISVIDGTTNTFADFIFTGDSGLAIAADQASDLVFIGCTNCQTLRVINGATDQIVNSVTLPWNVSDLTTNPNAGVVFVGTNSDAVYVVNENTLAYSVIGSLWIPTSFSVNPNTDHLFEGITNSSGQALAVDLNISSDTYASMILPTGRVQGIGVDLSTNRVYVYVFETGQGSVVTVIDGATDTVLTSIKVGDGYFSYPWNLAVNPVTDRIYAVNQDDSTVSVIDGSTDTVVATISVT